MLAGTGTAGKGKNEYSNVDNCMDVGTAAVEYSETNKHEGR